MRKDAFYFSHDSNAKDDPKCVLLIEQLGLEGYGIYWVLIETLRDQPSYKYPVILLPALARRYNTTAEKMKAVVNGYGLFVVDENDFFSISLMDRMKKLEAKREQQRLAGIASGKKRSGCNGRSTGDERLFNGRSTGDEPVKESIVNEIIEEDNTSSRRQNKFSDTHFELARLLLDRIKINNPEYKLRGNIETWANDIRLMIEQDGRLEKQVRNMIEWCQSDGFWKGNILSAKKLREKYDQMKVQANRSVVELSERKHKQTISDDERAKLRAFYGLEAK